MVGWQARHNKNGRHIGKREHPQYPLKDFHKISSYNGTFSSKNNFSNFMHKNLITVEK